MHKPQWDVTSLLLEWHRQKTDSTKLSGWRALGTIICCWCQCKMEQPILKNLAISYRINHVHIIRSSSCTVGVFTQVKWKHKDTCLGMNVYNCFSHNHQNITFG